METNGSEGGAPRHGRRRRDDGLSSHQNLEAGVSAANITSLDETPSASGGGHGRRRRQRQQEESKITEQEAAKEWMEEKKDEPTREAFGPGTESDHGNAFAFGETTTEVKTIGQEPSFRKNNKAFDDNEDTEIDVIQEIPDLDEEKQQDLTTQVAHAPRNVSKKVQSLEELEEGPQAKLRAGGPHASEVDLSLLSSTLAPSDAVQEEDEYWDLDRLLQQMAQELQSEHERKIKDGVLTKPVGQSSPGSSKAGSTTHGSTPQTKK